MKFDFSLIQYLKKATRVAVLTGAGISQESGIPTFRDSQTGLWKSYSSMELASPLAFQNNPLLVWNWYRWRRKTILDAEPNPAHVSLKALETIYQKFSIITQNVDGLHHLVIGKWMKTSLLPVRFASRC